MSFDLILPFFRPIEHLLLSDTVSEIMVNPDSSVWIEEDGEKTHLHRIRFEQGALEAGLEVIANRFGKKLDADSPIMNLRLPDGSRLAAIIPPVVNPRPLLTIRKFTSRKLKMGDLVSQEFITSELAARLQ
jgi:pilus assembly protein CpaF